MRVDLQVFRSTSTSFTSVISAKPSIKQKIISLPHLKIYKHTISQCHTSNTSTTKVSANAAKKTLGTAKPSASAIRSRSQVKVRNHHSHLTFNNLTKKLGGWDRTTEVIPEDFEAQVAQAFENVNFTLKDAGGKGWDEVYSVRTYTHVLDEEAIKVLAKYLKKWCPNHQPLLTGVGIASLAFGMKIEIEVTAHVPK